MQKLKAGDRVVLRQDAEELIAGMVGTVRITLNGDLGVEFEAYSGAGYNAGFRVVSITGTIDGKMRHLVDVCSPVEG